MKRVSSALIAGCLVPGPGYSNSLSWQLYDKLRTQIVVGQFSPGQRMPSTRVLAADLGVSRNTVLQAFEQLKAEGYLRGTVGSGTHVADPLPDQMVHASSPVSPNIPDHSTKRRWSQFGSRVTRETARVIVPSSYRPFDPGQPALDAFPFDVWTRLFNRHRKTAPAKLLGYGAAQGYGPLRTAIASYLNMARGVRCRPEQVIIVSGAQQALDLISRLLLDPGDSVLVEEPGYRGAHVAFEASAAKIIPLDMDDDGLKLPQATSNGMNARLLYTTPSHQYPLGTTMSVTRRIEVVTWAAQNGLWVIEDDYDSEFRYYNRPVPALQSLDRAGCVILLGTLSKVLFPALRLGYLVVPTNLVEGFVRAKAATDYHCPTLEQAVVADFMEEGHFGRHIRRMRTLYLERLEVLLEAMRTEMNGALEVERPEAGMHVLARLNPRVDDVALARAAASLGVSTTPLSACYIGPPTGSGLLLGYAGYRPQQIRLGVRKLSSVLARDISFRR